MIRALVPVNRVLCLGGIPILRQLPVLRHIPGIRGLCDVVALDLPGEDRARLRQALADAAPFFAPNHPEFFTDWMLDKEMMAQFSPMAACWATHVIVNGMGPVMQRFWLKNNLIAQVPGTGGTDGKAYSVRWALAGHGVLLHPEGNVGWHGDVVAPLFPGVVEMAVETARQARANGSGRRVIIAPLVWKLRFRRDASAALAREMTYVERRLGLEAASPTMSVSRRIHAAYSALLARDEQAAGIAPEGRGYGERQRRLLAVLAERLVSSLALDHGLLPEADDGRDPAEAYGGLLRVAERVMRQNDGRSAKHDEMRRVLADMRRILRFRPSLYPHPRWTQEHMAECIKRIRSDYLNGTVRDTVNRYLPRPAGSRVAHIRVPEPIDVTRLMDGRDALTPKETADVVAEVRQRMQACLDRLNREIDVGSGLRREANPFHQEQ